MDVPSGGAILNPTLRVYTDRPASARPRRRTARRRTATGASTVNMSTVTRLERAREAWEDARARAVEGGVSARRAR